MVLNFELEMNTEHYISLVLLCLWFVMFMFSYVLFAMFMFYCVYVLSCLCFVVFMYCYIIFCYVYGFICFCFRMLMFCYVSNVLYSFSSGGVRNKE